MNLSGFFAENARKVENIRFVASERFTDEKGKALEWEIRCITSQEDEALRKSATHRVTVPGKRTQFTMELDINEYLGKLGSACTVFPNLTDAALQDSYHVMGAEELLKTMLLPGEFAEYMAKVQEVCKFDRSLEDEVETAKN